MNEKAKRLKKGLSSSYMIYTTAFIVLAALVYFPFLQADRSLIWKPDGVAQQYSSFVYFGSYVREIISNFIHGSFTLPQWDFSIGMGSDILTTLHYYSFGDPLNLLAVFVPKEYAAYGYGFVMYLRYYLAGLAFVALCRYKKLPKIGAVCGAMMYTFCTYSVYMAVRHPSFVNPFIYFPLIILGVEMIYAKKRPYLFIAMIFVSAVSSFYYFYVISLFTILYIFIRLFFEYKENFVKNCFGAFFKFSGAYLLGVLMAAIIFVPVVSVFLGSARGSVTYEYTQLFNVEYYKNFITSFAGIRPVFASTYLGFTILGWVGIILLFSKRKGNACLKMLLLVGTLMLMLPIVCKITNGFSYVANRWTWAYGLLISYIFAANFDVLKKLNIPRALAICVGAGIFTLAVYKVKSANLYCNKVTAVTFIAFALGCLVYSILRLKGNWQAGLKYALSCLVVVFTIGAVSLNSFFIYDDNKNNFVSSFLPHEMAQDFVTDNGFKNINDVQNNKSAIERYETTRLDLGDYNDAMITRAHGTTGYYSLTDGLMNAFQRETGLVFNNYSLLENSDCDPFVQLVQNVKFFAASGVSENNFGIDEESLAQVKSAFRTGEYNLGVYENKNYVPFGFAYKNVISQADYDALTPVERRTSFLNAVTINDTDEFVNANAGDMTEKATVIPCEIQPTDGVLITDGKIFVQNDGAEITVKLSEKTPKNSQLYCQVNNMTYTPMTGAELKAVMEAGKELPLDRSLKTKMHMNMRSNKWGSVTGNGKTFSFNMVGPENDYYSAITDYTANFGYAKDGMTELTLKLGAGMHTCDSIQIIAVDMSGFEDKRDELSKDTLQNLKLDTNKVSGEITASADEMLYLSIPYSKYWTAIVDGEEAELYRANTAFTALPLTQGAHTVELKYSNTVIKYSAVLSALGFAIFIGVIVYNEKKKSK